MIKIELKDYSDYVEYINYIYKHTIYRICSFRK